MSVKQDTLLVKELRKGLEDVVKRSVTQYKESLKQTTFSDIEKIKTETTGNSQIIRAKTAFLKLLKPTLYRMDTTANRINMAKLVRNYIVGVEECITTSTTDVKRYALVKKLNATTIEDLVYFDKNIGTPSVHGFVYMNVAKKLVFSTKIMPNKFAGEVDLLKKMSQFAETGVSPNMPIVYKVLHCINPPTEELQKAPVKNTPQELLINKGQYYIVISELADGDLHTFLKEPHTDEEYQSVIMQIIIALRTFHIYTSYAHDDAHLGNFLFHKITAGGYWHYKLEGTDMYVPNVGYLVVLWDFSQATRISEILHDDCREFDKVRRCIARIARKLKYPILDEIMGKFKIMTCHMDSHRTEEKVFINYFKKKVNLFEYIKFKKPEDAIINPIPYEL